MTQVRPTNTPPAKHVPDPGRIVQEMVPPFVLRPREKNRAQVKSSSSTEDSSDEKKHAAEAERVAELAAVFSNNNDDDGGSGDGSAHHNAEAEIAVSAPPQPDHAPDIPQAPVNVPPQPTQGTAASSEEDEMAAELATLGEDPGIFELTFPGGAQLAVAIGGGTQGLNFFLSTENGPLGKKLKSKKKELATSLERRIGRTLNLIVL